MFKKHKVDHRSERRQAQKKFLFFGRDITVRILDTFQYVGSLIFRGPGVEIDISAFERVKDLARALAFQIFKDHFHRQGKAGQ